MCAMIQVTGCTTDDMCPADQKCNSLTGVCIVGRRSCTGESQCSSIQKHCDVTHQQCVDCLVNTDCTNPRVCSSGVCVDPNGGCTDDAMCGPPTAVCQAQQCVPGCQAPGSPVICAVGQLCDSNTGRCVNGNVTCMQDSQCNPPQSICTSGQCIPGCTQVGGLQCTGGNICNA